MEKILRCRDIGTDCDYVIRAKTQFEIMEKASEHVKRAHHLVETPEEVEEIMEKVRSATHYA